MKPKTYVLGYIGALPHRDRIMAKRELRNQYRKTQRPFGLIELFSTEDRRRARLPHQGARECARRASRAAASE